MLNPPSLTNFTTIMKTFFRALLLLQSLFLLHPCEVSAQDYEWAKSKNKSEGIAVSLDSKGNSYVTGYFAGTVTFGAVQLTSYGSFDIFISKIDPNGNCLWTRQAGGSDFDCGKGIAVDHAGNIYIVGTFRDTALFGSVQLIGYGSDDIFIAKYDSGGNCLWAEKAGSKNQDDCLGIILDNEACSYITGYFQDTASFGSTLLLSPGSKEIYIAKYDSRGKCLWAKETGGGNLSIGLSIGLDADKRIYITGSFQGPGKFGAAHFNSNGKSDLFISRFDSAGNWIGSRSAGGPAEDVGYGIAVNEKGICYVTGLFEGPAPFGLKKLRGFGKADIFIAKYDSDGTCIWARQAGGNLGEFGRGISVDSKGNSYITGSFQGTALFDTISLTAQFGAIGIFIAKYDKDGKCIWAKHAGDNAENNWGNSIAVDSNGNTCITGRFQGEVKFGTVQLNGTGKFNTFIAKYDPAGTLLWLRMF